MELHSGELRDGKEQFRLAFERAHDIMLVFDFKDYRVREFNESFLAATDYSREEVVDKRARDLRLFDEDRHYDIISEGLKRGVSIANYQLNLRKKNGETFIVRSWASMFQFAGGDYILFCADNITDEKNTEEELRAGNERYRALSDAAFEAIFIMEDENFIDSNAAASRLFGYSSEEFEEIGIIDIIAPESREIVKERLREHPEEPCEIKALRKDGTEFYAEGRCKTANYQGKNVLLIVLRDIEDRKLAEEKLKEINLSKDKFFSIIAHDLKGPLSGFLGLSERLSEHLIDLSVLEIQEFSKTLNQSAQHLYKLLENLLAWSRAQLGTIQFNPDNYDLNDLILNNFFLFQDIAEKKMIVLNSEVEANTILNFDYDMMDTILRNLISNAVKFTHPGGKILIKYAEKPEFAEISVIDNGIGMKEEDIDNLFKIDISLNSMGTAGEKGTGLGLILCKEFIEWHGGKITVSSEPGEGSAFTVFLPKIFFVGGELNNY